MDRREKGWVIGVVETDGKKSSVILWTLVFGVAFNLLGWAGNNFLLGDLWDAAGSQVKSGFSAPWPPVVKEIVTIVSDFIYAFAMVWMFANARRQTIGFAIKLAVVIWLAGAALVYLVLVNSGFLPLEISAKTSLLALAIFVGAAPIMAFVLRR